MEVLSSLCYCRGKNGTFKYCIRDRFKLFKSRSGWWHFCKFPLGIIIRHDAGNALKIIENSVEPLVVKDAVATITELSSGKWFDRCVWDDFYPGLYEKKKGKSEELQVSRRGLGILERFTIFIVVITTVNRKSWDLRENGKCKVYFAVGIVWSVTWIIRRRAWLLFGWREEMRWRWLVMSLQLGMVVTVGEDWNTGWRLLDVLCLGGGDMHEPAGFLEPAEPVIPLLVENIIKVWIMSEKFFGKL